ncbi:MAG: copper resistance protein CopC [Cycloclasticus sp.]|nr:copper resistance protein CopC [Cycloclasticus sp.]
MTKHLFVKLYTLTTLLFLSSAAFSHAKSVSSDPAPRSVVSRSPEFIAILFNQQLEPAYSTIVVTNSSGNSVTNKTAVVDSKNNKRLILALPHLAPDKYTVSYKVLSLDGHVVKSTYKFRIKKEAPLAD